MKKLLILSSAFMLIAFSGWAQKTVAGTVLDDGGLPLPGATVIEKGTSNGVSTDFDGNFSIEVAENAVLEISFIGYSTAEISASADDFNITLSADNELEEVIILGYTSQRRSEVTGSVTQLDSEDLTQLTVPTVDQALQGQVAGLTITQNSGTPGSTSQIRIRGISSITAGNEPLYVIDGVPVVNGNVSNSDASSFMSALSAIDANNIASISVLKDAASTAQYGARGANGVILITTKGGQSGEAKFNISSYYGVQNDAIYGPEMLTAQQRFELYSEGLFNDNPSTFSSISDAGDYILANVGSYTTWDANGRPDSNWADAITNDNAPIQEHNFSASGGDEKSTFYASLGYMKQEATVIGASFDRISGALNITRKLNDKLTFSSNNSVGVTEQEGILEQSAYFEGPRTAKFFGNPLLQVLNEDGTPNQYGGGVPNPLYITRENINDTKFTRIVTNNSLSYDIMEGLTFGTRLNIDYLIYDRKSYSNTIYGYSVPNGGELSDAHRNAVTYVVQNYLDYNWELNDDHSFDFKLLQEYQTYRSTYLSADGESFPDAGLFYLDNAGSPVGVSSSYSDWHVGAYLASVHYVGFSGKYVGDLTYRREGNSRFGPDNRWGDFYSIGAAWNLHKEDFLADSDIFDNLKLRASYGKSGNANISTNQYQALLAYDADYAGQGAVYTSTFGNSNLSWETNYSYDVAVDFGMFDGKLAGSLGYYNRLSEDLLLDVPLSLTTGFDSQTANVGSVKNSGIEFEFNYNVISSEDFNFSIGGNLATTENEITKLAKDPNGDTIKLQTSTTLIDEGQPIYAWFLPTWAGVNPQTGAEEWYVNGVDGATTTVFNEAEQVLQGGSALPTFTAGLNIHLDYKGFFLDANGFYAGGHKVYEGWHRYINESAVGFSVGPYQGYSSLLTDAWRQPGDVTRNGQITAGTVPWQRHSKFLYDGDWARLRTLTFGFNFDKSTLAGTGLDGLRLYVRGNNLLTWKKSDYQKWDPEVDLGGETGLQTPPTQSFIVGLNLKF
jgi:TonB-dependent starch-binding outer membrane protein SusC